PTNTLALNKLGAGTLSLTGINTYTGTTTVNAGTLQAGSPGRSEERRVGKENTGGRLDLHGFDNTIGSLSGSGLVTNNGGANATLSVGTDNTSSIFAGTLQDGPTNTLALNKLGAGTLSLTGINTYTGTTTVNAGTLQAGSPGTFSWSSAFTVNTARALDLDGFDNTIRSPSRSAIATHTVS